MLKKKTTHKSLTKKKVEKPTLAKTKAKAWTAFSLYIRTKYLINQQCECYTCGHKNLINKTTAGHGISGRTNAVLFMEEVVRPQCIACNVFAGGRYRVFTAKLIDELGGEEYDRLAQLARKTVVYTPYDYMEIEQKYLKKLWDLSF